jgi:DNA-binding transcriptional MerR regulator
MDNSIEQLTGGWFSPEGMEKFFALQDVKALSRALNWKIGTVNKGAGKEYRLINHWDKEGLIPSRRDSNKQWRKFSIMDMIWLDIIEDLRAFGFSIENIRKVKEQLHVSYKSTDATYPLLEFFVFTIISNYNPVFLRIDANGKLKILLQRGLNENMKNEENGKCILLILNDYVKEKLPDLYVTPCYINLCDIDDDESSLIETIRAKIFQSIKVKMRGGKIDMIEGTEKIVTKNKRIVDLLKDEDYQNIQLKQENGKVVCINRTIKRKI